MFNPYTFQHTSNVVREKNNIIEIEKITIKYKRTIWNCMLVDVLVSDFQVAL